MIYDVRLKLKLMESDDRVRRITLESHLEAKIENIQPQTTCCNAEM